MEFLRDSMLSVNLQVQETFISETRNIGGTCQSCHFRPLPWLCFFWTLVFHCLPCSSLIFSQVCSFVHRLDPYSLHIYTNWIQLCKSPSSSAPKIQGYDLYLQKEVVIPKQSPQNQKMKKKTPKNKRTQKFPFLKKLNTYLH